MGHLGEPHPRCGALHTYGQLRASHLRTSHRGGHHASHRDDPSLHGDLPNRHGVRGVHRVVHTSLRGEHLHGEQLRDHHEHGNLHERGVKSMAQGCGHILERVPVHGMGWLDEENGTSSLVPIRSVGHSAQSDQPSVLPFLRVGDQLASQFQALSFRQVAEGQQTLGQMACEELDDVYRDVLRSVGHIHTHGPNHDRNVLNGTFRDL